MWKLKLQALITAVFGACASTGERHRELIINGEKAQEGRYPYFSTLNHYCGGALIAPDIILTAGHCKPKRSQYSKISLHVGTYSFPIAEDDDNEGDDDESDAFKSSFFTIRRSIRHPDFVRVGDDEFINDFTIIQLDRPSDAAVVRINRDDSVPAVAAESNDTSSVTDSVIAMGVGFTDPDGWSDDSKSDILMQVALNPVSNRQCEMSSDEDSSYEDRILPSHLCTKGGPRNERDACNYDSGSPIIIPGATKSGNHSPEEDDPTYDVLVALVSWGEGCANPDFPGVNARVSEASDWIDETVCAYSKYPPTDFGCRNGKKSGSIEPQARRPLLVSMTTRILALLFVVGFLVLVLVRAAKWLRHIHRSCFRRSQWTAVAGKDDHGRMLWTPRTDSSSSYGSVASLSSSSDDGDMISLR